MTVEDFEQWLNGQIDYYDAFIRNVAISDQSRIQYGNMKNTYEEVLKKYKSILPPPTTLN